MLINIESLLYRAARERSALGAFTVYDLETVIAVCSAAEESGTPVIMQISKDTLAAAGEPFCRMVLNEAETSGGRLAVQLDHCPEADLIRRALDWGIPSVMADGSSLPFIENADFTASVVDAASTYGAAVEGELGLIKGSEEGMDPGELNEKMTDPAKAAEFVKRTGVSHLAVCIGNRHGMSESPPALDIPRLKEIRTEVSVPLVLHGGSGLPETDLTAAIDAGICKINVNSELRAILRETRSNNGISLPEQSERIIRRTRQLILQKMNIFHNDQGEENE